MLGSQSTLQLYRKIIKLAKKFPSIKRNRLVQEIRVTFRKNSTLTDKVKIEECLNVAIKGVEQLSVYTSLDDRKVHWKVDLEKQPMPRR